MSQTEKTRDKAKLNIKNSSSSQHSESPAFDLQSTKSGGTESVNNQGLYVVSAELLSGDLSSDSRHDRFGGCARLAHQYHIIASELLKLESSTGSLGGVVYLGEDSRSLLNFRRGVCFISVEVLESFRDDLLDLSLSDETLFIRRSPLSARAILSNLPILGLIMAIGAGFYTTSLGGSPYLSYVLTLSLALPCVILWQLCPRGASRRMRFARVLSHEIGRRRGDGSGSILDRERFSLSSIFGQQPAAGAALRIIH